MTLTSEPIATHRHRPADYDRMSPDAQAACDRRAAARGGRGPGMSSTKAWPTFYAPAVPEPIQISGRGRDLLRDPDTLCENADDPDLWHSVIPRERAEAKRVCRRCPLRGECLAVALETGDGGIWGGTDKEERRAIRASGAHLRRTG